MELLTSILGALLPVAGFGALVYVLIGWEPATLKIADPQTILRLEAELGIRNELGDLVHADCHEHSCSAPDCRRKGDHVCSPAPEARVNVEVDSRLLKAQLLHAQEVEEQRAYRKARSEAARAALESFTAADAPVSDIDVIHGWKSQKPASRPGRALVRHRDGRSVWVSADSPMANPSQLKVDFDQAFDLVYQRQRRRYR
jgi:hypothetical protein